MVRTRPRRFGNSLRPFLLAIMLLGAVAATHGQPPPFASPTKAMDLPMIWLEAKDRFTRDVAAACEITLAAAGEEHKTAAAIKGTIRLRGSSSLSFPKRSYAIGLEKPAALFGLPTRQNWILNAAFVDRSLMRHKLSYDLFRSLAEPGRPRYAASSRFVEVNLNGTYEGVYLLMEQVDHQLAGLPAYVKEDQAYTAIYKAVNHDADFARAGHSGFEQMAPDPRVLAYWQPLDQLAQFIHASTTTQFFDAKQGIASHLDLDNAMDFHLLVLVTGNSDGITKNFYLARPKPTTDTVSRFFFIPWDFDGSFGQNWNATRSPVELWLSNHLFDRLLESPDYRRRFASRWERLRDRQFSIRSIHEMIDANAKVIAEASGRNASRWATASGRYPNQMTFEQDVAHMKSWIASHVEWLNRAILERTGNARTDRPAESPPTR